jgi:predicted dehydrogenase
MITAAILGGGFMGATHAKGFAALGGRVRVKTVASRTTERAQRVAESVGASFTTDLDSVLADPEVDLIDICLPTPLHRAIAERSLSESKHVFLEKPIALTLEDADAIVQAAEASDRQLMVGLVLRFFPEYVEIERRVRSGELGRPLAASAYRLSPPADWADWYADPSQSGGPPVDLMVHDFDQMNVLLGPPRSVYARGIYLGEPSYPNQVLALVEHEGGKAGVEGSMAMPTSYPFSAGIRVLCESGVIEHGFRALPAEDGGNIGADVQSFLRVHPSDGPTQELQVEAVDPWAAEIAEFVACLEEGRQVDRGTARQAREALAVSLATSRSLATGQPEAVEP